MNEHEFLKKYYNLLTTEKFDSTLIKSTEDVPYERLLVFLGLDEKDRERLLEITCLKQAVLPSLPGHTTELEFFRVQYQVLLPFKIEAKATPQLASLLCYLNRMIELHGFEMDEVSLQIYFRYVFIYGEKEFNQKLFTSLVGLIMLLIEMFSGSLDRVASGEITFNQILEEIIALGEKIKDKS